MSFVERGQRASRDAGLGFLYWLGFVLILEPGNLMRWVPPDAAAWNHEILRLLGAGLLGGAATPFILELTRRLPIEGPQAGRRAAAHAGFCLVMAFALIVASCLLAPMLPGAARRPLFDHFQGELLANGPLLAAWIAGLIALAHAVRAARRRSGADAAQSLAIRQRGRLARVDLGDVDWLETQGNYLALHGPQGARLIRQTAKRFEADLDPRRFVRIHRRTIVALSAIQTVTPLAAGDANVVLRDGEVLRVSRSFRAGLWRALDAEASD
jgi:DNA-binding LytR/AlgR family response regulator